MRGQIHIMYMVDLDEKSDSQTVSDSVHGDPENSASATMTTTFHPLLLQSPLECTCTANHFGDHRRSSRTTRLPDEPTQAAMAVDLGMLKGVIESSAGEWALILSMVFGGCCS